MQTPEQVTTDLAQAIEYLYHHPAERVQMGEAAYQFAQQQVWTNKISRFTDTIYPSLLTQKAAVQALKS